MRVLFTKRTYAPIGGSESLTYQWATRLAERGHDVRVLCGQAFDHRARFVDRGVEVVQLKPRGGIVGVVADASGLIDLLDLDEFARYAEDRDVVHNVSREYIESTIAVVDLLDLPLALTPLSHPGQFHGGDTPADIARYHRADVITTMTDWERAWLRQRGIGADRLITTGLGPNAVRSHDGAGFRARHRIPARAPIVLYIGRRERYKGFIHLLDATEAVWRRHPEARFVFIGVPGYYGAVVDEFARYTDERIIEIERASPEEKAAALDACDVFAMPSTHESFGLGYLEAWLHEKPVIGGDIPPVREVVSQGVDGLLVPQKVEAIAAAILHLLGDPLLRAEMGRAGSAKLHERWDWEIVMARVEEAHRRAVDAHLPVDEALA